MGTRRKYLDIVWIVLLAIIMGTVLILLCGANPLEAYAMFFGGVFGNLNGFCEIFVKATPLILTGLGCAVAFRTGFFNIGAEGQFYICLLYTSFLFGTMCLIPLFTAIDTFMQGWFDKAKVEKVLALTLMQYFLLQRNVDFCRDTLKLEK